MTSPDPSPGPGSSESTAQSSKLRRVFLESRYRKLARGLPQTILYCPTCKGNRWRRRNCKNCGGHGKLTKDSVQEFIARRVLPAFQTRKGKFHGAGREDLDVRMLGRGRPFVFEVVGARKTDVELEELRRRIHATCDGAIELVPFRKVSRKRVAYWKEALPEGLPGTCAPVRTGGAGAPGCSSAVAGHGRSADPQAGRPSPGRH